MVNKFKDKTIAELNEHVFETHKKLLETRLSLRSGEIQATHLFKELRKEIAQCKTLIRQKLGA